MISISADLPIEISTVYFVRKCRDQCNVEGTRYERQTNVLVENMHGSCRRTPHGMIESTVSPFTTDRFSDP